MPDSNEPASAQICMKSPKDLVGMKFYIHPYQRGYRWCTRQVEDLLRDLTEFAEKHSGQATSGSDADFSMPQLMLERIPVDLRVSRSKEPVYGLQPLIVKKIADNEWEVVDGQQRLTTLLILLHCLDIQYYSIQYKTLGDVEEMLEDGELKKHLKDSPDKLHLYLALRLVRKWLENKEYHTRLEKLLRGGLPLPAQVKFIWYELAKEGDAIQEFVNINSGKIALTKSELAKALILQRHPSMQEVRLQTIALQWAQMENALCEHDFWFFISKETEAVLPKSNRISLVLRMAVSALLGKKDKPIDEKELFKHVKDYFKHAEGTHQEKVERLWSAVISVFRVLEHWYATPELYNWVGFLVHCGEGLYKLYVKQNEGSATEFREKLMGLVKGQLPQKKNELEELSYDEQNGKGKIRRLLLFLNIHMLNKSQTGQVDKDLGRSPVYKFPFNLYAKESWDIEHIDSQTEDFDKFLDQTMVLCDKKLKEELEEQLQETNAVKQKENVLKLLQDRGYLGKEQDAASKDGIGNLTLLSAGINRSYGNVPFAMKRKVIRERIWQGKFVPLCTQLVFNKSYCNLPQNMMRWETSDKEAYFDFIAAQINDFQKVYERV